MIHNTLQLLKASCLRTPEKAAFSDAQSSISYRELWQRVGAIGAYLSRALGGARNQPVAVCIDRSSSSIIAFLGVTASGNFYVPLDPNLPTARLESILSVTQPNCILGPSAALKRLPTVPGAFLSLEDAMDAPDCDTQIDQTIAHACSTDPLYCIFTSGSTGVPKGVLVSHQSVINMTEQFRLAFDFQADTVFGNQAPFDFDVSVKDIYNALAVGGSVHVLERQLFMMPKRLIQRLNDRRVNTLIWAASAMKIVSTLKTFDSIVPQTLRTVMFSGEALPCKVLNDWAGHLPEVQFVNLYGPTEITCNCTYYKINRRFSNDEAIPIGVPFRNTDILLLDGDQAAAPGEIGEICVRGACLALGYYRNPEKTASAFCQNPLNDAFPERIYRTGDLARRSETGDLLFLGRADSQIKHMGHRIELGEIEVAANALELLGSACCLYDAAHEKICLFYQASQACDKEIAAALKKVLPYYMVPGRYIHMDKLPENRTGKIDRAALKQQFILPRE